MKKLINKRLSAVFDMHDEFLLVWNRTAPVNYQLNKYGISKAQWEEMAKAQGYSCAICGERPPKRKLAIDHCHRSGKVRGLLCSNCNSALGLLRDSYQIAASAAKYLKRNK